jgi:hypothetical protein
MRDVAETFLPEGATVSRADSRRILEAAAALHLAFRGQWVDGGCPLADRYAFLSPTVAHREPSAGVPAVIGRGWARFADVVPAPVAEAVAAIHADPTLLASALNEFEATLIHGDLKFGNIGLTPDRVVLVDWGPQCGMAPPAVEFAWYLALNATRLDATRDEVLNDVRAASGPFQTTRPCASCCSAAWSSSGGTRRSGPATTRTRPCVSARPPTSAGGSGVRRRRWSTGPPHEGRRRPATRSPPPGSPPPRTGSSTATSRRRSPRRWRTCRVGCSMSPPGPARELLPDQPLSSPGNRGAGDGTGRARRRPAHLGPSRRRLPARELLLGLTHQCLARHDVPVVKTVDLPARRGVVVVSVPPSGGSRGRFRR